MSRAYVIGVDPGLTTGIARINLTDLTVELVQATPGAVAGIVQALAYGRAVSVLAVEQFVVGPRAARSATPAAGRITRELITALTAEGGGYASRVVLRSAAQVKPWATDARLRAAGLLVAKGMPHALDAARHALFAAVANCGLPDPLSSRSTRPDGDVTRDH